MKFISFPMACDECGAAINKIEDAMVEWIDEEEKISEGRVVHHPSYSPNSDCYKHTDQHHRQDNHLEQVMGNDELKKKLKLS